MTRKSFRILYNQDCTDLFAVTREPLTPEHVDRMVDEVADGGGDVFLANPNAQRVNYPSRVWQTFWDGYAPGKRDFFGPVPDGDVEGRERWVSQMKRLADQGCDYLAHALARCRRKRIVPGISLRMNDMHDVPWPGSNLFSRFYMEHAEWRLKNPAACGWSATGLNYEHAGVREHYLELIREIATYDVEVLELDFLRFHCYFPRSGFQRHADIMTGFLREVRSVLDSTGRRIELIPRVATSPAAAMELGFDVGRWAREKIVDGVTAGGFFQTCWHVAVDEFSAALGPELPVYVSTDHAATRPEGLPERSFPLEPALMRGFGAAAHAAGADGVCLFNFFCTREANPPRDPAFGAIREMNPSAGTGKPKSYLLSAGGGQAEVDGPSQVPVPVATDRPRALRLWMAAEPEDATIEVRATIEAARIDAATWWLHVNHCPIGSATGSEDFPNGGPAGKILRFKVPAASLRDGANVLVFRNEGEPARLLLVEVTVS